ncbi:MAG: hypothetical protein Q7S95_00245 [bacterium]|nr:hypothetical protein [bacterium]
MSMTETTTQPAKRPAQVVVSRKIIWEGDIVAVTVPERAKVLFFNQEGQKFSYLAYRLQIFGDRFVNVHIRPAGRELVGTEVKGWLSIWEKQFANCEVYRYIDIEPVGETDQDEPISRCVAVVPTRASEVEIREGWTFYNIPHPTRRGGTLRGAILLYPAGDKVRIRKTADPQPVEIPAGSEPEPAKLETEATETEEVSAQTESEPESAETTLVQAMPESVPPPKPEPVRMGEVPRKPRRDTDKKKSASTQPRIDPARLKELAEIGFAMREKEGAIKVF